MLQGFFKIVVLFEQGGGVSEGLAIAGDDGGGSPSSDDGDGAMFDQRDERGGGEGVVDSLGDH